MKRKGFIKKGILSTLGLGFISGIYAWKIEPFWLKFVKVKMPIKNLPENLIGKTLMQISDIHVRNRFDLQYIIDSFEKTKKLNPDFVTYTGDYLSYENKVQLEQLTTVMKKSVKRKIGTIGILGNHNYRKNGSEDTVADSIVAILNSSSIEILRNGQKNFTLFT